MWQSMSINMVLTDTQAATGENLSITAQEMQSKPGNGQTLADSLFPQQGE